MHRCVAGKRHQTDLIKIGQFLLILSNPQMVASSNRERSLIELICV
jgi:hypothetical protein